MQITNRRCGLIAMVGILVLASVVAAAPPLADRLPAEASGYIGWAGPNDAMSGSLFGELLGELPLDEIMGAFRQGVSEKIGDPQARELVGAVVGMVALAANHPGAGCVTTIPAMTGNEMPIPEVALLIDLGTDRAAFDAHLAVVLAAIGDKVTLTDAAVGSVSYRTVLIDPEVPLLSFGYIDNMLFVTLGADMPGKLIALSNGGGASLLTDEGFTTAYREVAGDDEQSVTYVDVPAIIAMVKQAAQAKGETPTPSIDQVVDAIGLGKLTAIVSTTRIVDRKLYTKARLLSPAPHQGVLMPMAGAPMTMADMAVAPADADLLVTCSLDPLALWNETLRVVSTLDPEAGMKLQSGVGMLGTQLGFSVENDLLANMGDQFSLVSAPSLGGFVTGTAFVIELKNEAAFKATVSRLEAMAGGILAAATTGQAGGFGRSKTPSMYTTSAGDATITYLQLPMVPVVAPAWAVADGKLIIGLWPQVVRAVVGGPGVGGLDTNPQFVEAFAGLSGSPTMLCYVNEPALARRTYALPMIAWTAVASLLEAEGIPLRADWLPALPVLMRCLRPSIGAYSTDAGGITEEGYRALPISAIDSAGAGTSLAVSVLLPSLGRSRQLARQAVSMARLRGIGQAVAMYRHEHDGASPPSLQHLIDAALTEHKMLVSPVSNQPYEYIPLPPDAANSLILAYEAPLGSRQEKVPVLFSDTRVEMVPVDEVFWELVAQSKAAAGVTGDPQAQ